MKYDFDEIIPRRGTNSVKWDLATDERVLPMWVADMDFRTAPPVLDALERRLRHGVFGYTKVPDAYFEAVKGWFGKRYGFRIENEWILPTTGVIPALSVILKALTEPGDKVILQTPVYNCFFAVLERTGRQPLANPLINENGAYRMDFEDLERKAADPQAKLIFLCNPHNPAGRAWTAEEATRLGKICLRHGVTVISDEIHCDLTLDGHRHIPFASLNEEFLRHSVTCTAPSKTFNIAGLQAANIIAADPEIRRKIDRQLVDNELHALNAFAVEALIAAYNEGGEWLDELKKIPVGELRIPARLLHPTPAGSAGHSARGHLPGVGGLSDVETPHDGNSPAVTGGGARMDQRRRNVRRRRIPAHQHRLPPQDARRRVGTHPESTGVAYTDHLSDHKRTQKSPVRDSSAKGGHDAIASTVLANE